MILDVYSPADCAALLTLFHDTVHTVCAADYSSAQLHAWAPACIDSAAWNRSFLAHHTLVARAHGEILGFGDMDASGYLDRLYVHHAHQRRGVASAILCALEQQAHAHGVARFTTHASITARPFFAHHGYAVLRENTVLRGGVQLTNFIMQK